jgi:hypothetical protein
MPEEKDQNSYIPNDVLDRMISDRRLSRSGSDHLVLLRLSAFPRPRKTAAPTESISSLAAKIHRNKAIVSRSLRRLIRFGYVRQVWKRGLAYETAGAPPEYHAEAGYQIVLRGIGIDERKASA